MKNCQYCKTQLTENAKFCQACTAPCEDNKLSQSIQANIQSNTHKRKSKLGLGIIAIMVMALIAYLLWGIKSGANKNSNTIISSPPPTNQTEQLPQQPASSRQAYQTVIDDIKKLVIDTNNDNFDYSNNHVGILEAARYEPLQFAIKDIDNNGIDELLILTKDIDYNKSRIIELYTLSDLEPLLLFSGLVRNRWFLLNDNSLYNESSSGAADLSFGTFRINNQKLKAEHYYFSKYDEIQNQVVWFYNSTGKNETENSQHIYEDDAIQIRDAYNNKIQDIPSQSL